MSGFEWADENSAAWDDTLQQLSAWEARGGGEKEWRALVNQAHLALRPAPLQADCIVGRDSWGLRRLWELRALARLA